MCREAAGFEPAAGVTDIVHYPEKGVQSCQEPHIFTPGEGVCMYQALYRKWRPQTFDEVVGQKHITETLKNQVRTGRLSHAYIFIGTRGTGKTTCARILARAVNCEHPVNGNPCGECPACRGIADGSVLDVVELDAASNNGVDSVRALREEAIFTPASVKKRVYIIDEVHMLSLSAFNALLKILEEPPEHLMFILATTELQKVPATILSRCQRHSFRRIDAPVLAEYLEYVASQERFELTHDAAELIARMADGGVRDALSLLDQCSAYEKIDAEAVYSAMGLAGNRRITNMLSHILRRDTAAALSDFSALWMEGKDPASFLKELSGLLRDVLIYAVAPQSAASLLSGGYELTMLGSFAARMTREELICAMETVQRYSMQLREAKNPKTVVELCLVSLCDNTLGEDINSLRARVSRLERDGVAPVTGVQNAPSVPHEREDTPPWEEAPSAPLDETPPPPWEETPPPQRAEVAPSAPSASYEPNVECPVEQVRQAPVEKAELDAAARETSAQGAYSAAEETAPADTEFWEKLCASVAPKLPPDLRFTLSEASRIRGTLQENVLKIECLPGFVYGRFNRQEVLERFAQAAKRLCGREVRVILSELSDTASAARSVDELKQFKEVRFV